MSDVEVSEQRLPGVGWRYEIPAGEQTLVLVVEDRGPRYLKLMVTEADLPTWEVKLSASTSAALAALLTGARVTTIATDERSTDRP